MRIWEIDLEKGKKYEDQKGLIWTVHQDELVDSKMLEINVEYDLRELLNIDFTEVIDWSKVAVDTPVWVRNSENALWETRHFSHFKNELIYCFDNGRTSHTEKFTCGWNHCSLTDPNKGE